MVRFMIRLLAFCEFGCAKPAYDSHQGTGAEVTFCRAVTRPHKLLLPGARSARKIKVWPGAPG